MQILFLCIKFYRKRTKFIKGRRSNGRRTKVEGLRFEGFDGLSYYATSVSYTHLTLPTLLRV